MNLSLCSTRLYARVRGSSQWWLILISFCRILSSLLRDVNIMSARGIAKKRQKNVSKSQRANVLFPVGRLHRYMKSGPGTRRLRIGVGAPVYAAAVIEYLTGEYRGEARAGLCTGSLVRFIDSCHDVIPWRHHLGRHSSIVCVHPSLTLSATCEHNL